MKKALGKEHPDYAFVLNYLANLYNDMSQYQKAEPLLLKPRSSGKKRWEKNTLTMPTTCGT
ncbi:MAG: tetratricopeptide repeat protein [Saprospiraceae bacterium]